jgi:phage terminase large subunit
MTTTDIEIENKRYAGDKLIIGDNSEGRLIEEIRRKGVNIKETVKIAVSSGIALMQDYEIVVTETSLNIIKELNNYSWSDKKSGTPIDLYNHCIDAIRYSVVYQLDNPNIKRMQPRGFGMKRN